MAPGEDDVLDSWKEIAAYLQRDVRTVMRWERTRGLPVHRLPGGRKATIYALKSEVEAWRQARPLVEEEQEPVHDEPAVAEELADAVGPGTADGPAAAGLRHIPRTALTALAAIAFLAGALALAFWLWPSWRAARGRSSITSIVVLPFENLGKDPAQDYIAEGVHEALITDLARTMRGSGLRVISHTSAEHYRGQHVAVAQIARELGVDAIVEGSVLLSGDRLLVNAQLVRVANEDHLWASRYERQLGDTLNLVTELSDAIRTGIQKAVTDGGAGPKRGTAQAVRPEIVDAYLRARYAYHSMTPSGLDEAVVLYQKALDLDPGFVPAWSGLAMARATRPFVGNAVPAEAWPPARDAARRALDLDAASAEAVGVLGFVSLYWEWDFRNARETLSRAAELSPGVAIVRHAYADALMVGGDVEASLEQVRAIHVDDPLSWPPRAILLYHSLMARRYREVVEEGRQLSRVFPDRPGLRDRMASALWLLGRRDEALAEWQRALGPGEPALRQRLQEAYSRGDDSGVLSGLADWTVTSVRTGTQPAVAAAGLYAAAGNRDAAFQWLDQSFARREPSLLHIVADPFFDPIRSDSRFDDLLARIGIKPRPR